MEDIQSNINRCIIVYFVHISPHAKSHWLKAHHCLYLAISIVFPISYNIVDNFSMLNSTGLGVHVKCSPCNDY